MTHLCSMITSVFDRVVVSVDTDDSCLLFLSPMIVERCSPHEAVEVGWGGKRREEGGG